MTVKLVETPKLLVVGSSGHASVLVDAIELEGSYRIAGYLDDTVPQGTIRGGYMVLGRINDANRICDEQSISNVVIAIGDNWWRRKVYWDLERGRPNFAFPIIKHPSTVIAATAEIRKGTAILARAHVGPRSRIGEFCIINSASSVDHDCAVHDYASIGPGVVTGGLVQIGECSAIGVGASVSDRISIGKHVVVGTGSVLVRDIPDLVVAYGNPARVKRSRREGEQYLSRLDSSSQVL